MKAFEFPAKITPEGKLELPESVLSNLSRNQAVRVIVLVDELTDAEADADWHRLASEQFLAGYADTDAVYDNL